MTLNKVYYILHQASLQIHIREGFLKYENYWGVHFVIALRESAVMQIQCHLTLASRRSCWSDRVCSHDVTAAMLEKATKKRRPSWRSEIFFWWLNSIFMQIPPYVSLCKHGFWSHDRTHSIVRRFFQLSLYSQERKQIWIRKHFDKAFWGQFYERFTLAI